MSNLAALPIIIPLIAGVLAALFHKKLKVVRVFAQVLTVINTGVVAYILFYVHQNGTVILESGDWAAPFGIVLVADMLSLSLALTTNIVAIACVFYAPKSLSQKQEEFYFYTFYFLLIAGVSGAFITGDLFNLFVFFEVLLMASYGLIVLGGEKVQLRESLKYVLINLFSSMLFVTTIAFLYSVVGTVNMAQIAERVGEVEQTGVLTTIGILLFFVFGTKAALFPLYYWLPKPYIAPNPVISALFGALLTKVGIYSLLRVFSLIFIHERNLTHEFFIWIAALTLVFGAIGALSTNNIKLVVAYNIIPAVGFMLLGIGVYNSTGFAGSVYYLINDMIIKAALFLLVGAIAYLAGTSDLRKMRGLIHHYPLLGWMFFIAAFVLAGIPPFSGFIGKLLLLQGAMEADQIVVAIIALASSLLILLSVMRIFIRGFWGEKDESFTPNKKAARGFVFPIAFLLFFSVLLGVGAEWFYPTIEGIGDYLMNPQNYIESILKE
ncbi:Na+/H+ antiporter subunit D [Gracilibacillus sp. S3-1-1]|uniref:Na+/H+ antiporter subunit D n=1 Tax=Gracilibacillus pellucidus TaxID=3095368 RepID=A0ACC6M4K4_9BACI|nr:Na+/H+ antiporter subunit D [Gracilibacillus sp. S3-1-1]MDX8045895.1 Na+/H+ antiporter subunit D [Gracilibacillus sp. S3-1-1]